jgi:hypothetical protein
MSDSPDYPPEDQLPEALRDALAGMYSRQIDVPPEIDQIILSSARANFARRRRKWALARRGAVAAAGIAAMLALAIRLGIPRTPARPGAGLQARAVLGDVNRDGKVDILDAFKLAKALHDGGKLDPAWDVNGDGKIDEKDVDWLARQAVRVESGGLQ